MSIYQQKKLSRAGFFAEADASLIEEEVFGAVVVTIVELFDHSDIFSLIDQPFSL